MVDKGRSLSMLARPVWVVAWLATQGIPAFAQSTEQINVDSSEQPGTGGDSDYPSVSASGQRVVFESRAAGLAPDQTPAAANVFLRDRAAGTTILINTASGGVPVFADGLRPRISGDGRFVVFTSSSPDLVAGDTNGVRDVYIHDTLLRTTERVSVSTAGVQGNQYSDWADLSADGRFVVFESNASNLVDDDTNGLLDVFLRDRLLGLTRLVSRSNSGIQGSDSSFEPRISGDGSRIVFVSLAANLDNDGNGLADIFLVERGAGTVARISRTPGGGLPDGASGSPRISANAERVAFGSSATNLVLVDSNFQPDIFVYRPSNQTTLNASLAPGGTNRGSYHPDVSADGLSVAFASDATNLGSGAGSILDDVYLSTGGSPVQIALVSRTHTGAEPNNGSSNRPSMSWDARDIAFASTSTGMVPGSPAPFRNIFLRDRGAASGSPVVLRFAPSAPRVAPGASFNLSWESESTSNCAPTQGVGTTWSTLGSLAGSGTQALTAPAALGLLTFQLSCSSGNRTYTASTSVLVAPSPPVIGSFSSSTTAVSPGASFTLSWSATGARACVPDQGVPTTWSLPGELPPSGSRTLTAPFGPDRTLSFRLVCTDGATAAAATLQVQVAGTLAAIPSFQATPSQANVSSLLTLSWTSTNTTSCTPQLGAGTTWAALGTLPTSGTRTVTAPASPGTVTFGLSCSNGPQSASSTTQVTVVSPGGGVSASVCLTSNASTQCLPDNTLPSCEVAGSVHVANISWSSVGASYCRATESTPIRTGFSQMSCLGADCPDPLDRRKLRPTGSMQQLPILPDNAGTSTTLTLVCYSASGAASAPATQVLNLRGPTYLSGECPLPPVVPSSAVSAPVLTPDGGYTLSASLSNPQGLALSATVLRQGTYGDATVQIVGGQLVISYQLRANARLVESPVIEETIEVAIVGGASGVSVSYRFQLTPSVFASGFEDASGVLLQDFASISANAPCPAGWICANRSSPIGTTGWSQGNAAIFPSQAGGPGEYLTADVLNTGVSGRISNWLISPRVAFAPGQELRFWTRARSGSTRPDRLEIRASTSGVETGSSATSTGDFSILLASVNPALLTGSGNCAVPAGAPGAGAYPDAWCEYRLTPSAGLPTSGSGYLAFRYAVENAGSGSVNSDYIGIDSIRFGPPP